MCGILGQVGRTSDVAEFRCALGTIANRGPDGSNVLSDGYCQFGHVRLAIVDLSAAGSQPMVDHESGCWIVFNGEIYNYIELRAELAAIGVQCQTQTDTEVALRAFLTWGPHAFNKFNGMWGLAVWDPRARHLTLSRDRFGVKPLYYRADHNDLCFASEPKAIHSLNAESLEPNIGTVAGFLADSRFHIGQNSFYASIKALPPAHFLTYTLGDTTPLVQRYWDYPSGRETHRAASHPDEFHALFLDSLKLRMRADVPVGITLSGGLDSSAVLAGLKANGTPPYRCYTSVYRDGSEHEENWARIAGAYGGVEVHSVESDIAEWSDLLPKVVHHMDAPGASPAAFALWSIMQQSRNDNVPVLLEGQGADEAFGGYPQHNAHLAYGQLTDGQIGRFIESMRVMQASVGAAWGMAWLGRIAWPGLADKAMKRVGVMPILRPEIAKDAKRAEIDGSLSQMAGSHAGIFAELLKDHAERILPALLQYGDAISMAQGIEARLPFMDYRLVEWVFRAQPSLIDGTGTKVPIRNFLRDMGFERIARRHDKKGYPTPVLNWLNKYEGPCIDDMLLSPNALLWDWVNPQTVASLRQRAAAGSVRSGYHLFKLVTMSEWLDQLAYRRKFIRA